MNPKNSVGSLLYGDNRTCNKEKKKTRSVNTSVWYVGRGKMMYLITEWWILHIPTVIRKQIKQQVGDLDMFESASVNYLIQEF